MPNSLADGVLEAGASIYGRAAATDSLSAIASVDSSGILQLGAGVSGVNVATLQLGGTAITASAAEINRVATNSTRIVNCTASTLAVTVALHDGKTITLNRAAGITVTLPAATGSGTHFRLVVGTTFTGNGIVKVASANDYMIGDCMIGQDGGLGAVLMFGTANTGTVATESDTLTFNGTTTGGIKGAVVEVEDIATAVWSILARSEATGSEATPFSAGV